MLSMRLITGNETKLPSQRNRHCFCGRHPKADQIIFNILAAVSARFSILSLVCRALCHVACARRLF